MKINKSLVVRFIFLISTMIIFILVLFNRWYQLPKYQINQANINGLHYLNSQTVTQLLKEYHSSHNMNVLIFNKKKLKQYLEQEDRLKVLSVKALWPNRLNILLEEKKGIFIVRIKNNFFQIDRKNKIIATNDKILFFDIPIFTQEKIIANTKSNLSLSEKLNSNKLLKLKNNGFKIYQSIMKLPSEEQSLWNDLSEVVIKSNGKKISKWYLKKKNINILMGEQWNTEEYRRAYYGIIYWTKNNRNNQDNFSEKLNNNNITIDVTKKITKYIEK